MSTVLHQLAAWADSDPNSVAQSYKENGQWKPISAREFCDRVYWLALFLESKGITSEDIGTILSYNCPQWVHMDLAPILLGGKSAGLYPNSTAKDIRYILEHTQSRFLSVQNKEYFHKVLGDNKDSSFPSSIEFILVFDGDVSIHPKAISYQTALDEGRKIASTAGAKKLTDFLNRLDPNSGAFIIYTSGTTGNPKGAILSHDNLVWTVETGVKNWDLPSGRHTLFSFLPLCHVAEKVQNVGVGIGLRYNVKFCSKFENVSVELPEVQPTLLLCVPRVWEKMMEGVEKKVDHSPLPRKVLARWALGVGKRMAEARFSGRTAGLADQIQWKLADRIIISKIRAALGLTKVQVCVSGAAVLPVQVCRWFRCLGIDIMEILGMTESTAIICMSVKGEDCIGTVGKPLPGTELKIAEDGEIVTRGRHVFKGYLKDSEATSKTIQDGWLLTGDIGEMNSRGMLVIKGRKKEVMKTSGGKMVAPLPIEEALKAAPIISQVCVVGDGRKYLTALITLSESKLAQLSRSNGALKDRVVTSPEVVSEVKHHVDEINSTLASYSQIKKFAILSKEFSIESGEMTPTLKMKRGVVEKRYNDLIEAFYHEA